MIGFDTGPGNTLIDCWIQKQQQHPYDKDGQWAAAGEVQATLLTQLLADPYFEQPYPKSTGPEYFNLTWLENKLTAETSYQAVDIQSTLTEFTAQSIMQTIQTQVDATADIYLCGGGIHNQDLIRRMKRLTKKATYLLNANAWNQSRLGRSDCFCMACPANFTTRSKQPSAGNRRKHAVPLGCICFK